LTNGELELKLQEMEKFKQDLTVQNKAVAALKQACIVSSTVLIKYDLTYRTRLFLYIIMKRKFK